MANSEINSPNMSFAANYLEQLLVFENYFLSLHPSFALVAKLVDAPDLGSGVAIRVGSSPIRRTMRQKRNFRENFPLFLFRNLLIFVRL